MLSNFEKGRIASYVLNAMNCAEKRSLAGKKLLNWCQEEAEQLGIGIDAERAEESVTRRSRCRWRLVLNKLRQQMNQPVRGFSRARPSRLETNIRVLGKYFGLTETDIDIFRFSTYARLTPGIGTLASALDDGGERDILSALANLLDIDRRTVAARVGPNSLLLESGLIAPVRRKQYESDDFPICTPQYLANALVDAETGRLDQMLSRIVGVPVVPSLEWGDFVHLGEHKKIARDLLSGALKNGERGVNILVYGPPGTGKTEFCQVLVTKVGASLFQIGETNDEGNEPVRGERVAQLRSAQKVLSRQRNAVLLFDEMEDLLGSAVHRVSKVFGNRLVEEAQVPTLWTTNDLSQFDPALLRRMSMVIEMKMPSRQVRERVWRRNLQQQQIDISDAELRALASDPDASPGLAANAARTTRLAGGGADRLQLVVTNVARAMRGGAERSPTDHFARPFDGALVNADTDLSRLAEQLSLPDAPRDFSLCLYGPPGTGKSAFARFLASRLGLEILVKRTSDLLSMWLGESEKNIAAAFAEAREERAILVFDEADSLLSDRATATQSWEVTQVNEMLTWMERHPLPFVCTTNLMERLDPACLRRFTVKSKLDYLTCQQANAAFKAFFGLSAPGDLSALTNLTPGDFEVVRRKGRILGGGDDPAALVAMLRQECALKPNAPRRIGFI